MHELSENTKRAVDVGAWSLAGLAGGLTLAQVALIISMLAGLMSIAWTLMRFYDRLKYGRGAAD